MNTARIRLLLVAFLPALSGAVAGAEAVLFRTGFEGTLQAEKATGEGTPVKGPERPTYVAGVRGQAVRLAGEGLHYARRGNIRLDQGTVVFWMRPADWEPEKKTPGYEWTFCVCGTGAGGDRIQFFKMPGPMLMFFMGREGHVKQITYRIRKWPSGRWRFIAFSWDKRAMRLYLDGNPVARVPVDPENMAVDPGPTFRLQSGATTDYDELRIFGRSLSERAILALYGREAPAEDETEMRAGGQAVGPITQIPRVANRPVVDGRRAPGEWDEATLISGFLSIPELELADRQTRVRLCYDDVALYALFTSPVEQPLPVEKAKRDSMDLWQAPSAELLFQCGSDQDLPVCQLVFNTLDTHFDQRAGDRSWNPEWVSRSSVRNGLWTAEVAIPFDQLEVAFPRPGDTWRLNIGRNLLSPKVFTNPVFALAYANAKAFWGVRFAGSGQGVGIETTVDVPGAALRVGLPTGLSLPVGARIAVSVKRLPLDTRQRRRLGDFAAATGEAVVDADRPGTDLGNGPMAVDLPGPGRYLARIRIVNRDEEILHRQTVHFVINEPFVARLRFLSKDRVLLADWELGAPASGPFVVAGEVRNEDGVAVLTASERMTGKETAGTLRFDMARLDGLRYEVVMRLTGGEVEGARRVPFTCFYNAEWIGFEERLRQEHRVPEPWTPIQVKGAGFRTLTQRYTFGSDGLPVSMVAAEEELLSTGVDLRMRTGRGTFAVTKPFAVREQLPDEVVFSSTREAEDARAELTGTLEFDGMLRYDLTLTPTDAGVRLTELVLELPMRREAAQLKYPYRGAYQKWDVLDLPAEVTDSYADAFMPHIWVGDDRRGLAWFAPSDEHFEPEDRNRVIELSRTRGSVLLRVNMVTFPRRLVTPITITFGIQATPARPLPVSAWTAYRFASSASTARVHVTTGYTTGAEYHVTAGVPYPARDADRARQWVEAVHRRPGRNALIYATSNGMGGNGEAFRFFEQEWKNPLICDTWSFADRGEYHWGTCPTVSSLRDYFLWSTSQAIDAFGIDGLYYDYATVFKADNPAAACGYTRAGKRFPTWPVFADRELRRRVYELFMAKRGRAVFVYHNYSQTVAPIFSFATLHLDGESYQRRTGAIGARVTTDYTRLLTLPRIRAMFGTQFGTVPYFLPKLAGTREDYGTSWLKAATRTLAAMMLPHGVPIWGFYCDIPELNLYTAAQDRFGIEDSRFVPYYRTAGEVEFRGKNAESAPLVSYWAKPGSALVVVGNLGNAPIAGGLVVAPDRLLRKSETPFQAVDACSGQSLEIDGNGVRLSVPAKDYALVWIRSAGKGR